MRLLPSGPTCGVVCSGFGRVIACVKASTYRTVGCFNLPHSFSLFPQEGSWVGKPVEGLAIAVVVEEPSILQAPKAAEIRGNRKRQCPHAGWESHSSILYPHHHRMTLRPSYPGGSNTGLPCSACMTEWFRSLHLFARTKTRPCAL